MVMLIHNSLLSQFSVDDAIAMGQKKGKTVGD